MTRSRRSNGTWRSRRRGTRRRRAVAARAEVVTARSTSSATTASSPRSRRRRSRPSSRPTDHPGEARSRRQAQGPQVQAVRRRQEGRGFTVTFNNAKSDAFKSKLRDKMIERIAGDTATRAATRTTTRQEEKEEEGARRAEDDEDPDGTARRRKRRRRSPPPTTTRRPTPTPTRKRTSTPRSAASARTRRTPSRSASTSASRCRTARSVHLAQQLPEAPKTYKNAPVPGPHRGELYPFAFINPKGIAGILGFAGEYDKTLSLTLRTTRRQRPGQGDPAALVAGAAPADPVRQQADLADRHLGAGYGRRTFKTDRSD